MRLMKLSVFSRSEAYIRGPMRRASSHRTDFLVKPIKDQSSELPTLNAELD